MMTNELIRRKDFPNMGKNNYNGQYNMFRKFYKRAPRQTDKIKFELMEHLARYNFLMMAMGNFNYSLFSKLNKPKWLKWLENTEQDIIKGIKTLDDIRLEAKNKTGKGIVLPTGAIVIDNLSNFNPFGDAGIDYAHTADDI